MTLERISESGNRLAAKAVSVGGRYQVSDNGVSSGQIGAFDCEGSIDEAAPSKSNGFGQAESPELADCSQSISSNFDDLNGCC